MRNKRGSFFGMLMAILLIAIILGFLGYYLYQSYPPVTQIFNSAGYNPGRIAVNASSEIKQFLPNMRFASSRISYFINSNCNADKSAAMTYAFHELQSKVAAISFYPDTETNADILVGCSADSYEKDKNEFVAGEGGPTGIINSSLYPIIVKGKVLIYNEIKCDYPVTELHELLHVFGFDHINNAALVMYPYVDCKETLDPRMIDLMNKLYSVRSLPDLYFSNITASKTGRYMNMVLEVDNQGLANAQGISVKIEAGGKVVDNFDIGDLEYGSGKIFTLSNEPLPSADTSQVIVNAVYSGDELNKENNMFIMQI